MKVLIIDDEKNIRQVLKNELATDTIEVDEAENGQRGLELLEQDDYDVVLLDLNMPRLGGIEVLKKMKRLDLPSEVIVLTANATIPTAVEAMKLGAYDYLTKPFRLEELSAVIEKAFEKKKLHRENLIQKTQLKRQAEARRIIAGSAVMRDLMETVKKIASSDYPVLVIGESGVGKELVATAIHRESPRSDNPFIPLNCGAIPENMIESELFGYEKGAFTGAGARKPGLLEMANNGSLFLDEIGDMPTALQVKLLRVIETGSFFRLGGTREQKVNIRIIAATNKDLQAEIARNVFRQDLFYRISTLTITIAPLRERSGDIPLLIGHFKAGNHAFRNKQFSKEALALLSEYPWPGNVRELRNVVHRAFLLSKNDTIGPAELPLGQSARAQNTATLLDDVEREHILKVLKASGNQRNKAAEALGIDTKTLYRKLTSYGVKD